MLYKTFFPSANWAGKYTESIYWLGNAWPPRRRPWMMCVYPHSVPHLANFWSNTWPRSDSNGDHLPYIKSLDMGDESRYGTVVILLQGSRVAGWNILLFVFVYLCVYLFTLVFNIMCSSRTCIVFLPICLTCHLLSPTIKKTNLFVYLLISDENHWYVDVPRTSVRVVVQFRTRNGLNSERGQMAQIGTR